MRKNSAEDGVLNALLPIWDFWLKMEKPLPTLIIVGRMSLGDPPSCSSPGVDMLSTQPDVTSLFPFRATSHCHATS